MSRIGEDRLELRITYRRVQSLSVIAESEAEIGYLYFGILASVRLQSFQSNGWMEAVVNTQLILA